MKIIASLLCLFCTATLSAQNQPRFTFEATQGYGRDQISSKMKFESDTHLNRRYKKLAVYETRLAANANLDNWFAKADFGYGDLLHGKAHYSILNMHLHGKVKNGYTFDGAVAAGRDFPICDRFALSPFLGYMWEKDRLHSHHFSVHSKLFGGKHSLHGFKSKDNYYWNAPFVGVNGKMDVTSNIDLYAGYKFIFALKEHNSFRLNHFDKITDRSKRSKGFGNVGTVGCGYKFCKNWALKAEYEISDLHAKGGNVTIDGHRHHASDAKTTMISSQVRLCLDFSV